jgi:tetratricopeptide (TPR) repeat protein
VIGSATTVNFVSRVATSILSLHERISHMTHFCPLDTLRNSARHAYERGEVDQAFSLVERCFTTAPDDPRTRELLGLVQYSSGQFEASVSSLETASAQVPLSRAARVCLAHGYGRIDRRQLSYDLLLDLSIESQMGVSLLLQVATGMDQIDRPDTAMTVCRRAVRLDPQNSQAFYDLGYYIGRCGGDINEIEPLAQRAIALDPDAIRYRIGFAGLLSRNDRSAEAYELVRELSVSEIESVSCGCCLDRLVGLYRRAGDQRRLIVCQNHLIMVELGGGKSSC